MMKLAFEKSWTSPLGWIVYVLRMGNHYHSELVFSDGTAFSSVIEEGCRFVENFKTPRTKWTLVDLPQISEEDERRMRAFAASLDGRPYDVIELIATPFGGADAIPKQHICSAACVVVLKYGGYFLDLIPFRTTPQMLHDAARSSNR